ncbi:hypothetical protein DTO282F9_7141 [Paecilomyces variotii]|nr:hypothetical protein DTO282F9_7141 [Paecilomyces variotii]
MGAKRCSEAQDLLKNHEEFKNWAHPVIGMSLKHAARAIAPLRSDAWLIRLPGYRRTAYGRSHYNYTLGEMIINSKLDQIWVTRNTDRGWPVVQNKPLFAAWVDIYILPASGLRLVDLPIRYRETNIRAALILNFEEQSSVKQIARRSKRPETLNLSAIVQRHTLLFCADLM